MSILSFQKPEKVLMHKNNDFYGSFEFRPLEPGFGVTIGNALRRVLLSSLEGYAITSVRLYDIPHEFSTIKGVLEDCTDIILNLKQIRLKKINESQEEEEFVKISIKGKDAFLASEITAASGLFEVINKDLVICHLEKDVNLDIELTIKKGRGYVPSEENKQDSSQVGTIYIDSIHTPIKNVKYTIDDYRVERKTDYERLFLDIETDGTILPEDALKEANKILMQHLALLSNEEICLEIPKEDDGNIESINQIRRSLNTDIQELGLTVRSANCLRAADINYMYELVSLNLNDLLKFRNFGKKSLNEIRDLVESKGLHFGMDVRKYLK
ncbi:MAG: DNA-directed RNA polymerase subunit alpha [Solitalea-like symbiont of Acarus siro]